MSHRLDPLLKPRSIAFVGASPREKTPGNGILKAIRMGGYEGKVYAVNPKYPEIEGYPCFPSLSAVPESVDLAVLCVGSRILEEALAEAIRCKAGAVAIFDNPHLENDTSPPLVKRLQRMAREAGLPLCGANGMGYYGPAEKTFVCGYPPPAPVASGGIFFITHSGTAFGALTTSDPRLGFSTIVSSGMELATTMADYMDYALEQPSTRVLALFMETVRDPAGFIAALEKANAKGVPVVALKIGRTETAAKLAVSHSGAIAGNDAAYEALFDRYGVVRVNDLYEMAAVLTLLSHDRKVVAGNLAALGDSGGERGMLIDLAADLGVEFARINEATIARLRERLVPGLDPVNPVDAWGTMVDWENIFRDCLVALQEDPDTGITLLFRDLRSNEFLSEGQIHIVRAVADAVPGKPIAIATNFSGLGHRDIALRAGGLGIPVIDGTRNALVAVKAAMGYRDFCARPASVKSAPVAEKVRTKWRVRLAQGGALDETESLALLADYGVPVQPHAVVDSAVAALEAAKTLGFPVVLKTATQGILHKTDKGGVKLGIVDEAAFKEAYDDMAKRLGPRVLVAPMAGAGVELALGMISDAQWGPLVIVGAGGTLIEVMKDRAVALPPVDEAGARRMVDRLRLRPLLDGKRGAAPSDMASLARAVARLSALAADLGDLIGEIDVNPLRCGPQGAVALDALVVAKTQAAAAAD
ncbi:MAG: acetate--CoA ligase family protein [Alphaproteobacteria bacterium]|nr:acetate--CoA ligase family protein [Alphaproteobacteria bacterium]